MVDVAPPTPTHVPEAPSGRGDCGVTQDIVTQWPTAPPVGSHLKWLPEDGTATKHLPPPHTHHCSSFPSYTDLNNEMIILQKIVLLVVCYTCNLTEVEPFNSYS